jgi:hypothetical protein
MGFKHFEAFRISIANGPASKSRLFLFARFGQVPIPDLDAAALPSALLSRPICFR